MSTLRRKRHDLQHRTRACKHQRIVLWKRDAVEMRLPLPRFLIIFCCFLEWGMVFLTECIEKSVHLEWLGCKVDAAMILV